MSRIPFRATYRLQLTPDFGFAAARDLIPYLRDLGVSHLYLSPSLQARAGSRHGYDVIDPTRVSDELGGEVELRRLAAAAHAARMGLILDIVPNHMATDDANPFWSDPRQRARFFDIESETQSHRRFFDIDDLAGVRQEDPEVFEQTHALVLRLVGEDVLDGLRIDHPDGLADPAGYFARLRERGVENVWIEKILEASERLRDWPVNGTVGYEFLNDVCALFVDGEAAEAFTELWQEITGDVRTFAEVAHEAKLEQATGTFRPETERLARVVDGDVAVDELARAAAAMPVYRTYVEPSSGLVTDDDRRAIDETGMDSAVGARLLLEREAPAEFVIRFQQTSPPVVAKGVEDTAFYRYGRLLALNDVGGDPGRFGITTADFHRGSRERADRFPLAMLTTNTHDTKRSADVRARIAALTWIPDEWGARVRRWMRLTEELRSDGARGNPVGAPATVRAPDDLERYFIFQTLAGVWPIELERLQGYMEKALREAKRNTNWVDQNADWERAVLDFCRRLYSHEAFLSDFEPFVEHLAALGDRISLGMLALKLTAPGIPDIYQGDELPFHALVDPDNRRPVDWDWHRAMLARLLGGSPPDRPTAKLWLTMRLLQLRVRHPAAFDGGDYVPLDAGEAAVAFLRGDEVLVVVATRPAGAGAPAPAASCAARTGAGATSCAAARTASGRRSPSRRCWESGEWPCSSARRIDDMPRAFITGSADGLGLELARRLDAAGHEVVLHGRNEERAADASAAVPHAVGAVSGDLASVAETRRLGEAANELGPYDVIVHNAAVYRRARPELTEDGVEQTFAVNVLAPYVLTALITPPARLIYLTSGLHRQGSPELDDLAWERRRWTWMQAYADSKLFDVVLAFAVARLWPAVRSNAVEPGWIATKMGGAGAPGTLAEGTDTQFWLATADEIPTGRLFYNRREEPAHPAASDPRVQDELLGVGERLTGLRFPAQ